MNECTRCHAQIALEDTFTISGLGGKHWPQHFCEPCVDAILAEDQSATANCGLLVQ